MENPELFNTESKLRTFAENGHTSSEMLRATYINKIDAEKQALESMEIETEKTIEDFEDRSGLKLTGDDAKDKKIIQDWANS